MGRDLVRLISQKAAFSFRGTELKNGDGELLGSLDRVHALGIDVNSVITAARQIASGILTADSVDTFIDRFAGQWNIELAGKTIIAHLILEAERQSTFTVNPQSASAQVRFSANDTDWLQLFATMLFSGVRRSDVNSLAANTNIICFNYDRCLERYLTSALIQGYGLESAAANDIVSRMNIVHPYGHLGPLPINPLESAPDICGYGASPTSIDLNKAAARLRTFSEVVDEESATRLREMVLGAQRLVFLGFAFHGPNVQLLSIPRNTDHRRVYASGVGLSSQEQQALSRICQRMLGYQTKPMNPDNYIAIEVGADCRRLLEIHRLNLLER